MGSRIARWALAAAGAAALLAAACGGDPAVQGEGSAAPPAPRPAVTGAGRPAPEFTLEDVDGRTVSLAGTSGRVRLLDFWATWCAPCREEVPMLKTLDETYRERGLEIVAISDSTDPASSVRDFVRQQGIGYTSLLGTDEVSQSYMVLGLPTAFLIDGEGVIVETFVGPKPRKVLEAKIVEQLERLAH